MVNGVQGKRPQPLARRGQGRHRPVVAFSPVPAKRLWLVYSLLAAGLAGLAIRLAWVQVIPNSVDIRFGNARYFRIS